MLKLRIFLTLRSQWFSKYLQTAAKNLSSSANTRPSNKLTFTEASIEKDLVLTSCGKLYKNWAKEKKYWTQPKSEITFNVKYIDTGYQKDRNKDPIVLAMHGTPGSYTDFTPLNSCLYERGSRIVIPNLPGKETLEYCPKFRHTPEEKSEFLRDFVKELNIPRIDLLVCHSSALFPGLHFCLDSGGIPVHSLALINPTGFDIPRSFKPVWLARTLVRISVYSLGYKITSILGKSIANKPELKGGSFEEHFLSALSLLNTCIPTHNKLLQVLLDQNLPVLLAFSLNDKLIRPETSFRMADMMVERKDLYLYNKDGQMTQAGGSNPFRRVLAFEKGSHFLLKTNPRVVCEAVSSFLFKQLDNRIKLP